MKLWLVTGGRDNEDDVVEGVYTTWEGADARVTFVQAGPGRHQHVDVREIETDTPLCTWGVSDVPAGVKP